MAIRRMHFSSVITPRVGVLLYLLFLGLPSLCLASDAADDECIYNPAAFKDMLAKLHHKHPGSKYTPDHGAVIVPLGDGQATVAYGGCEHYGTEIAYVAQGKDGYSRKAVFAKAVGLVAEFGQGRINLRTLQAMLDRGRFTQDPDNPGYITVPYPGMDEFTIQVEQEAGKPLAVTVSFYN